MMNFFGHNYDNAGLGSFGKCANAAASHSKGPLPGSGKMELMINRSFSAHATLSGEGRTGNCTVRFVKTQCMAGA